jgi:hypothetical protein
MAIADGYAIRKNDSQGRDKKEKSEFFLKVGVYATNESDQVDFISLPFPLYLDSMKPSEIKGEGEYQDLLAEGNKMLEDLMKYARESLKPGESKEVGFKVRLYRAKPKASVNPKIAQMTFCFDAEPTGLSARYEGR